MTGNFRVLCDGQHELDELSEEEEQAVDAIATQALPAIAPGPRRRPARVLAASAARQSPTIGAGGTCPPGDHAPPASRSSGTAGHGARRPAAPTLGSRRAPAACLPQCRAASSFRASRGRPRARGSPLPGRFRARPRRPQRRTPPRSRLRGPREAPGSSGSRRAACRRRSSCTRARSGARAWTTSPVARSRAPSRGYPSAPAARPARPSRAARSPPRPCRPEGRGSCGRRPPARGGRPRRGSSPRQRRRERSAHAGQRRDVQPVQQREHESRLTADALERASHAGCLGRDDQHVGRLAQALERPRVGDKIPEGHAAHPEPPFGDDLHGARPREDHHVLTCAVERAPDQASNPARSQHRNVHRSGSMSTPGFITPAGSTASFAPRTAPAKMSGRCWSYQGL